MLEALKRVVQWEDITLHINPKLTDGPEGEYLTDRLTNETIDFIESRDKSKPFAAFYLFIMYILQFKKIKSFMTIT